MARKRDATPKPARPKRTAVLLIDGDKELPRQIKGRVRSAHFLASLAVNREMVLVYWRIGRDISSGRPRRMGATVIDRLAAERPRARFFRMYGNLHADEQVRRFHDDPGDSWLSVGPLL